MKYYGIMFEDYHGRSDDLSELIDVFYNEEDCENEIERKNNDCSSDESYYIVELSEEDINKYWNGYKIS